MLTTRDGRVYPDKMQQILKEVYHELEPVIRTYARALFFQNCEGGDVGPDSTDAINEAIHRDPEYAAWLARVEKAEVRETSALYAIAA